MSVKKTTILLAALALALPAIARADEPPDVMQILKDADAATKAVRAVSYQAEFYADGERAKKMAKVSGKVITRKQPRGLFGIQMGHKATPIRIEGKAVMPGCPTEVPFDCAVEGREVFVTDHKNRVFLHGEVPVAQVPYLPAGQLYMREFVVPRPFGDEVNGQLARHEGVKEIGGVPCDVVYVLYSTGADARWYFGQEDHLPRGVERLSPDGNAILLLTNLDADPEIGDTTFRPACPQGYQEQKRVLIKVDPEALQDYVGTYRINDETTREVMVEDGRIFTRRTGYHRLEIFPVAEDRFFYADSFLSLSFFRDEKGQVTQQVLDRLFGDRETAVKTDQPAPGKTTAGP